MFGLLGQFQLQQPQVALELALAQGSVLVAGVVDDDIAPADLGLYRPQRRQDLLVDAEAPAHLRVVAEEAQMVHHGGGAAGIGQAHALHHVAGHFVLKAT